MIRNLFVAVAVLALVGTTTLARAEERTETPVASTSAIATALAQSTRVTEAEQSSLRSALPKATLKLDTSHGPSSVMLSMYATTATMQLLDLDSTIKSLNRGAIEANPMMSGIVGNHAVFAATKIGMAAGMIYMASRIAKHNKLQAALTLAAINSAYAMIVSNNYKIANR